MDSPASDTPRQSLLAFLGRPSRPRTLVPPRPQSQSQDISHSQSQSQAQNLGQRQGISSNEQQHQNQQQFPNPQPPLSATLSQLLPQSPISPRRQTITTAPVSAINNNTSTSPPALGPSSLPMQTGSFGNMLRRRRSATNVERAEANRRAQDHNSNSNGNGNNSGGANASNNTPVNGGGGGTGPTHRIRLVPLLESVRSLAFEPISRDVRHGDQPLRIGRFTEHSSTPGQVSNKLAFKSKVVSRGHAEVWFENGSFFIKDTKSSSGTFLNNIRLSPPNAESKPFPMKDGDVLQLGVDYQGGTEEMYRCVKIRIELGREWQTAVNAFNLQALQQLRSLANPGVVNGEGPSRPGRITPRPENNATTTTMPKPKRPALNTKAIRPKAASKQAVTQAPPIASPVSDCCICLSSVTICQALFIAPCSHAYHYKCIRPLLQMHHPGFSCPLCRTFANLEADVEGGEFLIGAGNGFGAEGVDDQMIVDGEGYEGEGIDIVEEEVEVSDEVDGGAGGGVENMPIQGAQGQSQAGQQLLRPRRLSITPEAGVETEAGVEVDGEGDAGSQTDTPPEMMGHHGIGGSAPLTQTHTQAQAQAQGGATENGRLQGLIHNPAVDIDPSALRSSLQPILPGQNLRLPVREDDSDPGVNSGVAVVAGHDSESSVPDMVAPFLIREDVGELGGIGSSHGPSAIATLVNTRR